MRRTSLFPVALENSKKEGNPKQQFKFLQSLFSSHLLQSLATDDLGGGNVRIRARVAQLLALAVYRLRYSKFAWRPKVSRPFTLFAKASLIPQGAKGHEIKVGEHTTLSHQHPWQHDCDRVVKVGQKDSSVK